MYKHSSKYTSRYTLIKSSRTTLQKNFNFFKRVDHLLDFQILIAISRPLKLSTAGLICKFLPKKILISLKMHACTFSQYPVDTPQPTPTLLLVHLQPTTGQVCQCYTAYWNANGVVHARSFPITCVFIQHCTSNTFKSIQKPLFYFDEKWHKRRNTLHWTKSAEIEISTVISNIKRTSRPIW